MYLKGFLVLVISLFCFCYPEVKAYSDTDYISDAEQNLFSTQYRTETVNSRLNRLEINVFGKANSKYTSPQRVQKLKSALGSFNQPIQPQQLTQPQKIIQPQPNLITNTPKNALEQYPIVDEIEKQVLNKTFQQENIYKRLDRLELVIFNKNFNDPLSSRVDRLRDTVIGTQNNSTASNNYSPASLSDNSAMTMDSDSTGAVLSQLEKVTFNASYQNEPTEARLDRLEMQIFNQTSPDDEVDSRVERLATVISAQPTNELYKDMSQLRQYQSLGAKMTAAAMVMFLIKGLFF